MLTIHGDVGASGEDSGSIGINGNSDDDSVIDSGAAYVFTRSAGGWNQDAYLKASNTGGGDNFGWSVAVSGDTVVVGANREDRVDNAAGDSGAAYVFFRSAGVWLQQAYLKASNMETDDNFGYSVAVSGNIAVVGAYGEDSTATGVGGNGAVNGSLSSGAAYVFNRSAGAWSQQAYLKASNTGLADFFGISVAVSGETVVVGASQEDSAATVINGNESDNSFSDPGAAYVFLRSGGVWSQEAYLKASNTGANDRFGENVSVSGDTIVVGASGEASAATGVDGDGADDSAFATGAAYVFFRSAGGWNQQAYLKASNTGAIDQFGASVAVSGNTVVVGANFEDSAATGIDGIGADSAADSGAAYVFTRSAGVWSHLAYLKASNTDSGDHFGRSVAVSGDTIIVGARYEGSAGMGASANEADDSAAEAGAAYVFLNPPLIPGSPQITVVRTPRPFARTRVGKRSRPQILLVRNSGEATLTGLRLTLPGIARREFPITSRLPVSLEPGATGRALVAFKPSRTGLRKATMFIGGNAPARQVRISGRGLPK